MRLGDCALGGAGLYSRRLITKARRYAVIGIEIPRRSGGTERSPEGRAVR